MIFSKICLLTSIERDDIISARGNMINFDFNHFEFKKMENLTVAKIRPLIKNGFLPDREPCQQYTPHKASLCNCFVNALGFSNQELTNIGFNINDFYVFGGIAGDLLYNETVSTTQCKNKMFEFLQNLGLEVCSDKKILKSNEWRVALYFSRDWNLTREFHWLRERNDHIWEGKIGFCNEFHEFSYAPKKITLQDESSHKINYRLENTYVLSNPQVKTFDNA